MKELGIAFKEGQSYDYIYVDDDNQVHLLCPITAGDTIGLDNTCKSTKEIGRFFGINKGPSEESAVDVLRRYKSDLEFDLALSDLIEIPEDDIRNKRERLEQIEQYLKCMSYAERIYKKKDSGQYPPRVGELLEEKTNCFSILLAPRSPDFYTRASGYIFSAKRSGSTPLRDHLINYFYTYKKTETSSIREKILKKVQNKFGEDELDFSEDLIAEIRSFLQEELDKVVEESIDLSKTSEMYDEESGLKGHKPMDLQYLTEFIFQYEDEDEDKTITPRELADYILGAAASPIFWEGLNASHFDKELSKGPSPKRSDTLSVLTQFLLAEINLFCHSHDKTKKNFGEIIEGSKELRSKLSDALTGAKDIEQAIIKFINENKSKFGLKEDISSSEAEEIIARFNMEYRIIKDSPHLDEFVLFNSEKEGEFVNHHNRISFHFAHFLQDLRKRGLRDSNAIFLAKHLSAFSDRSENRLPVRNGIEKEYAISKETLLSNKKLKILNMVKKFSKANSQMVSEIIKLLLERGDNINQKNWRNKTALHYAVEQKNFTLIRFLLENGADISVLSRAKLEFFIEGAIKAGDSDLIKLLIDNGFDFKMTFGKSKKTALMLVAQNKNYKLFKLFLENGVNPSIKDLVYVLKQPGIDIRILQDLIRKGVSIEGDYKTAALEEAFKSKNYHLVGLLVESGADSNTRYRLARRAFRIAINKNDAAEVELLSRYFSDRKMFFDLMEYAIKRRSIDPQIIRSLHHGWRYRGNYAVKTIGRAIDAGNLHIVKPLIEKGVDLDLGFLSKNKQAALMKYFIKKGDFNLIKLFLDSGFDPNMKFNVGSKKMTPLVYAVREKKHELIDLLLKKGANPTLWDPMMYAIEQNDIAAVITLLNYYKASESDYKSVVYRIMDALKQKNIDIRIIQSLFSNLPSDDDLRAYPFFLHYSYLRQGMLIDAISAGNYHLIDLLVEKGAGLYGHPFISDTPMSYLVSRKNINIEIVKNLFSKGDVMNEDTSKLVFVRAIAAGNYHLIDLLIEKGAKLDSFDKSDQEFLIERAVRDGSHKLLKLLLDSGFDPNMKIKVDSKETTPLVYAVREKKHELVDLLLKKGADHTARQPMMCAIEQSDIVAVKTLLNYHKASESDYKSIVYRIMDALKQKNIDIRIIQSLFSKLPSDDDLRTYSFSQEYDDLRRNMLRDAIFAGNYHLIGLLVEKGADPNGDDLSKMPMRYLVRQKNIKIEVVENLFSKEGLTMDQPKFARVFVSAISAGNYYLIDLLIEKGAKLDLFDESRQKFLIKRAIEDGNHKLLKLLLDNGAKLDLFDESRQKFLIKRAIEYGNHKLIKLLLDNGVNLNIYFNGKESPLMSRYIRCNPKLIKLLLESGVDPYQKDQDGKTALYYAVRSRNFAAVKAYLENGVNPNKPNRWILHEVIINSDRMSSARVDILKLLLENGLNLNSYDYLKFFIERLPKEHLPAVLDTLIPSLNKINQIRLFATNYEYLYSELKKRINIKDCPIYIRFVVFLTSSIITRGIAKYFIKKIKRDKYPKLYINPVRKPASDDIQGSKSGILDSLGGTLGPQVVEEIDHPELQAPRVDTDLITEDGPLEEVDQLESVHDVPVSMQGS